MPLEDITHNAKELKAQVENIVTDNLDYYKLLGFKFFSKTATGLIKIFIVGLVCLLVLLLLCLAGGFALGAYWNNYAYGFLAMAGIILIGLFIFIALKKHTIDRPILRTFSEFFNEN